jgi:hypothetical protein
MNASGDMVKMFAKFAVAEQETIADILMSMTMDKAQGALKVPTDSEVEAMLDPAGKEMVTKLKAMKGADFDKTNREHLNTAKLARGMINEHIAHLKMMKA